MESSTTSAGATRSAGAFTGQTLSRFNLTPSHIASLPPEVRDRVMEYVQAWGTPAERLELVQVLRNTHGPLLFLLDYQALAALANQDAQLALELIERRQNPTPLQETRPDAEGPYEEAAEVMPVMPKEKFDVELDGVVEGLGTLEMMPDGYGFLRSPDYN